MSVARLKRPRIGPRSAGVVMTAEEFDWLPESRWVEGLRYEMIHGILVVSPYPVAADRAANEELAYLLLSDNEQHPQGSALDATLPEHTVNSTPNRRRCDRAIWAGLGRQPVEETDLPTIVVEFVSRSKADKLRDYELKREEYRLAGVKEYWIIDRFRRRLTSYRFTADATMETVVPERGDHRTDLLPGFVLPLSQLLLKADAWPSPRRRRPPTGDSR